MRKALFCAALAATLLIVMPTASASAQERHSCGNYGYTEGADEPRFTDERVVGAAVEDIRTRVIGCPKARRMVKAFWNGRWDLQPHRPPWPRRQLPLPQPPLG